MHPKKGLRIYAGEKPLKQWLKEHPKWEEFSGVVPTMEDIQRWTFDGVCEAVDGCIVEPDGVCPHGYPSWLRALGLI
jgi:hypothetical protein